MLTVLNVAFPLATAGPSAVGGAEQVLSALDRMLVESGCRSLVVACEGSMAAGTLIPTPRSRGPIDERARARGAAGVRAAIAHALARWRVDVVHAHGLDFDRYLPVPGVPTLVTLHLPIDWYAPGALHGAGPTTWFNCVSESQRATCPPGVRLLPTIGNGVPLSRLTPTSTRRDYVVALGRIAPEKGFHLALDAARRAGVTMLLGGRVFEYEAHRSYFTTEIVPRLDARRRFVGPARFDRKRRLLAGARCLLVPSLAPETSSLVAMEALACGTPVVAFASGALAEIVDHGTTGFLVRDVAEMADAIAAAPSLDPRACRAAAVERFSADRMAARYLDAYRELAAGGCAERAT